MPAKPSSVSRAGERPKIRGAVLIHTHIWIWHLDGAADRMCTDAVELLRSSAREDGLLVSDISVWEVATKSAKGKLTLSPDVSTWVDRAGRRPGFTFLPLDRQILLRSTRLPGTMHGDRADRMLIASAVLAGVPLVTADRLIIEVRRAHGLLPHHRRSGLIGWQQHIREPSRMQSARGSMRQGQAATTAATAPASSSWRSSESSCGSVHARLSASSLPATLTPVARMATLVVSNGTTGRRPYDGTERGGASGGANVLDREVRSELDLAEIIHDGLSYRALDHVLASDDLEPAEAYDLVGSRRTLMRKKKARAKLSTNESDRLARVVRIIARAEEALRDREKARRWLRKPNRALSGRRPIDLLDSDAGTRIVERVLGRIEHGVYS